MPQASIITAAYNAEAWLAGAVKSVLNQDFQDWEMIVVADDGKDYAALLESKNLADQRLRFCSTGGVGMGPAAARNLAAGNAKSDIIINLDADDSLSSDYLTLMIPAALKHGAATPLINVIDAENGQPIKSDSPSQDSGFLKAADLFRYRPTYAPIAYNRAKCDIAWPPLHYGEDLIFWLKLMEHLPGIFYMPQASYHYSFRKGSLSRPEERDTHKIVSLRRSMAEWVRQHRSEIPSYASLLIDWLESCNEMEAMFNYQLVDIDTYQKEVSRRLELILKRAG